MRNLQVPSFRCVVHMLSLCAKAAKDAIEPFIAPFRTVLKFMRKSSKATTIATASEEAEGGFGAIVRVQYDCKTRFMSVFFLLASLLKHKTAVRAVVDALKLQCKSACWSLASSPVDFLFTCLQVTYRTRCGTQRLPCVKCWKPSMMPRRFLEVTTHRISPSRHLGTTCP